MTLREVLDKRGGGGDANREVSLNMMEAHLPASHPSKLDTTHF